METVTGAIRVQRGVSALVGSFWRLQEQLQRQPYQTLHHHHHHRLHRHVAALGKQIEEVRDETATMVCGLEAEGWEVEGTWVWGPVGPGEET